MRFLPVFSAVVAAALCVSNATAAECELTSTMGILKKVESNPAVKQCGAAAGFSLNPPPGRPTKAQLEKLCAAEACRPAIRSLSTMNLPSCTIGMLNGINLRSIVDEISAYCQAQAGAVGSEAVALRGASAPKPAPATPSPPSSSSSSPPSGATVSGNTANGKAGLRKNCHN